MSIAEVLPEPWIPKNESHREWAVLSVQAPQLAATMRRYLVQLTTFLAPRSVDVADSTLRQLARWLVAETDVAVVSDITRTHIEGHCCIKRDCRRSCFWQRSGWMPESGISCIYRAFQYKNLGAFCTANWPARPNATVPVGVICSGGSTVRLNCWVAC